MYNEVTGLPQGLLGLVKACRKSPNATRGNHKKSSEAEALRASKRSYSSPLPFLLRVFAVANPSLIGAILGCLLRWIRPRDLDGPNSFSFCFCFSVICLHETIKLALEAIRLSPSPTVVSRQKKTSQHVRQLTNLPLDELPCHAGC